MSNTKTVMGQASNQYVAPTDITDVFSTHLYDGTGSAQTITNGIDLSGEGGMVWIKGRNATSDHALIDTERGGANSVASTTTDAQRTDGAYGLTFNSNGFDSTGGNLNVSGREQASWTFRKAPKFFDVVTWSGNGTAGRTVSHNLGSVPGMIIVKRTDATSDWAAYHRQLNGGTNRGHWRIKFNSAGAQADQDTFWNDTAPTDSVFTVGTNSSLNNASGTYVAYLFAHNDGDGNFGPNSDQDIIKCGSYSGNGVSQEIDIGFEAQWLMIKRVDNQDDWTIYDSMRNWMTSKNGSGDSSSLEANNTIIEQAYTRIHPSSRGFGFDEEAGAWANASGAQYIYMAIRRGPLTPPTAGTEVFAHSLASGYPRYPSGFTTDFVIQKRLATGGGSAYSRLQGNYNIDPSTASQESASAWDWAQMTGSGTNFTSTDYIGWSWKRAPGYFDVVAYKGDGTANQTFSHGLAAKPDMVWIKNRGRSQDWWVGLDDSIFNLDGRLNDTSDFGSNVMGTFTDTTVQTLNQNQYSTNYSGDNYIAYLFASLAGVSKVGSVSHTGGSATDVDCGFTAGCRFLILKRVDAASDWWVFDTVRGITSGNDARLLLNSTSAETSTDQIDPYSAGFTIDGNRATGTYIFYAIA
jgi:hypothetical protein